MKENPTVCLTMHDMEFNGAVKLRPRVARLGALVSIDLSQPGPLENSTREKGMASRNSLTREF